MEGDDASRCGLSVIQLYQRAKGFDRVERTVTNQRADVCGAIAEYAKRNPNKIALRSAAVELTYGGLLEAVIRLERAIAAIGIDAQTPVGALCENCAELMLMYYAMGRLGGTFVPINPSLSAPEVAYIVENAELKVLFHDLRMAEVAVAAQTQCSQSRLMRIDEFVAASSATGAAPLPASVPASVREEFLIIYTSGSTGKPKAVLFNQAAEVAGNASLIEMWGIGESDVTVVALPLGFLYGLSTAAATALQAGGEVVIQRRFHPKEILEALVARKATVFHGVPTMFAMILEYAEQNSLTLDLSFMRLLISAGAPLSAELKKRFETRFGKRVDDYYSLTETRPIFGRAWNDDSEVPVSAIGKAAPGAVIRIVDGNGREVSAGEQGELFVRAPSTLLRYWKDEALTREALVDGLFRTGDLGYRDAQGYYYLTGRIKDIIIRGGANIAPAEVQEVIETHEAIGSVAVVGVPDSKFGEIAVAYFTTRGSEIPNEFDLKAYCRQQLADFKVPEHFIHLDRLPLGITGKVDKKALLELWIEARQ